MQNVKIESYDPPEKMEIQAREVTVNGNSSNGKKESSSPTSDLIADTNENTVDNRESTIDNGTSNGQESSPSTSDYIKIRSGAGK